MGETFGRFRLHWPGPTKRGPNPDLSATLKNTRRSRFRARALTKEQRQAIGRKAGFGLAKRRINAALVVVTVYTIIVYTLHADG